MCSGIFIAPMPVLAWTRAVFFGRRAGDERYFSVVFYNVVWAATIGVVASITAVVLLTAGAIRSFPRLPRWSSPWWVLIWAAAAWLLVALLLLIGQFGLPWNVDLSIVLVSAGLGLGARAVVVGDWFASRLGRQDCGRRHPQKAQPGP